MILKNKGSFKVIQSFNTGEMYNKVGYSSITNYYCFILYFIIINIKSNCFNNYALILVEIRCPSLINNFTKIN